MATFASVALSGSSAAFSPQRTASSSADVTVQTLGLPGPSPQHRVTCSETHAPKSSPSLCSVSKSANKLGPADIADGDDDSSDDIPDVSCDSDSVLDNKVTTANLLSAVPKNNTLLSHKRGIKRKYRKSGKLKFTNIKRFKKQITSHNSERLDIETEVQDVSTRSSVCSESQPLPILHRDKDWGDTFEEGPIDLNLSKGLKR